MKYRSLLLHSCRCIVFECLNSNPCLNSIVWMFFKKKILLLFSLYPYPISSPCSFWPSTGQVRWRPLHSLAQCAASPPLPAQAQRSRFFFSSCERSPLAFWPSCGPPLPPTGCSLRRAGPARHPWPQVGDGLGAGTRLRAGLPPRARLVAGPHADAAAARPI
jgi:hypothetical protein